MQDKENKVIEKLSSPWGFMGYALRYRMKEILAVIIIILIGLIMIMNIGYDKQTGFSWRPAAKVNIDVKK